MRMKIGIYGRAELPKPCPRILLRIAKPLTSMPNFLESLILLEIVIPHSALLKSGTEEVAL